MSINVTSLDPTKLYLHGSLDAPLYFVQIVPFLDLATFKKSISIILEDFKKVITLLLIMLVWSGLCHFKSHNMIFPDLHSFLMMTTTVIPKRNAQKNSLRGFYKKKGSLP